MLWGSKEAADDTWKLMSCLLYSCNRAFAHGLVKIDREKISPAAVEATRVRIYYQGSPGGTPERREQSNTRMYIIIPFHETLYSDIRGLVKSN